MQNVRIFRLGEYDTHFSGRNYSVGAWIIRDKHTTQTGIQKIWRDDSQRPLLTAPFFPELGFLPIWGNNLPQT